MSILMKNSEAFLKAFGRKPCQKSLKILCATYTPTFVLGKTRMMPLGFQASITCFKVSTQCRNVCHLVDMSTLKQIPEAWYVIRGVGNCQLNNALEVLQMISKHQKVFVNRLAIEDTNLANAYRRTIRQLLELLETDGTNHNFPQCFLNAIGSGITQGDIKTLLRGMLQKGGETVTRHDIVSDLLELLHKSCEGFSENDRLAKFFEATVHISKDIAAVKAVRCDFAPSFFNYFVRKLHGCQKLVELDLSKPLLVPAELGKALPTMKVLKK